MRNVRNRLGKGLKPHLRMALNGGWRCEGGGIVVTGPTVIRAYNGWVSRKRVGRKFGIYHE